MSTGADRIAALDIQESAADVPTDPGVTRIARKNGQLVSAVAGGSFGPLGGGGGQDPAAVAIIGGSIAGTTIDGITPAQHIATQAYLDDFDSFKRSVYATMIAAVPGLTGFKAVSVGLNPMGQADAAATLDANVEGGGLTAADANQYSFGASVIQNAAIGNWAFAFEGKVVPGAINQFGLKNADFSKSIWVGTHSDDATHYRSKISAAGTTSVTLSVGNTNRHIFVVTDDGTTVKYWVDGAQVGSTTDRTNLGTAPMYLYWFNTTTQQIKVMNAAVGYVKAA